MQDVKSTADMNIKKLSTMLYIASDLERIGDHAENIAEYDIIRAGKEKEQELRLSPAAMEELRILSRAVAEIVALAVKILDTHSEAIIRKIDKLEEKIDGLCEEYTENHINRLKTEKVDPRGGIAFMCMITDLERCADHANNIASYFLDEVIK